MGTALLNLQFRPEQAYNGSKVEDLINWTPGHQYKLNDAD
jgi:hypothetical protein